METLASVETISLVPAVPTTVAVAIGRSINASVHPAMRVYDRTGHEASYTFTMELPR
ncbi:hypothetical protein AB0H79_11820 [Micrococcus luteus]